MSILMIIEYSIDKELLLKYTKASDDSMNSFKPLLSCCEMDTDDVV
jgi:hypothetical protein